ncbi:DUF952 domain-containing protein [Hymenobacter arizonensis]|uniref:Uncharacterized conserved protein, DUF952 family n=1 Tax=Hymenobacter arizonensis TaxID=1227077 RepID=A0A1I5SRD6_HYMAR|nr:DUF952 domain-containing protein [Hymenobacter arizonensis]SFP73354.1 Uncharacterized conserved protein, DUF952 family [Hymenobacter arizonensis]
MLYRIAEAADWHHAQQTGFFTSADLAADGFLHSSEPHQILETARRYYAGRADLFLLEWDEEVLAANNVRVEREWVASRNEAFAHVFGPVPLAAVRRTWPFAADAKGTFCLPPALSGSGAAE